MEQKTKQRDTVQNAEYRDVEHEDKTYRIVRTEAEGGPPRYTAYVQVNLRAALSGGLVVQFEGDPERYFRALGSPPPGDPQEQKQEIALVRQLIQQAFPRSRQLKLQK
jgi:hypothetical protein